MARPRYETTYRYEREYDYSHLPLVIAQCSSLCRPYATALTPVQTPSGCFPIEVVQFWRGEKSDGRHYPLHWAIFVLTSPGRGNYYELVGNIDTFTYHSLLNVPLQKRELWRGSHVVGYVTPSELWRFERHVAMTEVVRGCREWNCQNWVYEAVTRLTFEGLYTDHMMTFTGLQTQMCCLLEAWELGEI